MVASKALVRFVLALAATGGLTVRHAAAVDGRQICFKFAGPCPAFPEWSGSVDDSDYAYDNMGVEKMERCLLRAAEFHEWCQCSANDRVIIVHMPTGTWATHPPFPRQVSQNTSSKHDGIHI